MELTGFAPMGLFISLLFIIVLLAVISLVIRYSIDNSKLTREIVLIRRELEEIKHHFNKDK